MGALNFLITICYSMPCYHLIMCVSYHLGGDFMAPTKKNDQDKYIKMSISFEPKQFDQLMHYCETQERSASWVIRKALAEWLEEHKDDIAP